MIYDSGKKRISIRGLIVPVEWDEDGSVCSIALSTFDEQEYFISSQERGKELLAFIRKEVEVRGLLSRMKNRQALIVEEFLLGASSETNAPIPKDCSK
jgi:hypothetical protein